MFHVNANWEKYAVVATSYKEALDIFISDQFGPAEKHLTIGKNQNSETDSEHSYPISFGFLKANIKIQEIKSNSAVTKLS